MKCAEGSLMMQVGGLGKLFDRESLFTVITTFIYVSAFEVRTWWSLKLGLRQCVLG